MTALAVLAIALVLPALILVMIARVALAQHRAQQAIRDRVPHGSIR